MAVKRKARSRSGKRGASPAARARGGVARRTPQTRARPAAKVKRNRPAAKRKAAARKAPIFHTIDASEFVTTPEDGGTHFGPRAGQRTSCCGIPLTKAISVATSTREVSSVKWCPKVTF